MSMNELISGALDINIGSSNSLNVALQEAMDGAMV